MVGRSNGTNTIRIATSADVGNPKRVEFELPSKDNPLTPGEPKWANYVKGVLHHYSCKSIDRIRTKWRLCTYLQTIK